MLARGIDLKNYKAAFEKKFINFGEKAPIILSYAMDDLGVAVVCENSGIKYFYEWDATVPIKNFIHEIKVDISEHYPRVARKVEITRPITVDEITERSISGESLENIPSTITYIEDEIYRIDKILALQDTLILVNEATNDHYNYKYDGAIYFLKNYRNNDYKDEFEAGVDFFKKATLVSKLNKEDK